MRLSQCLMTVLLETITNIDSYFQQSKLKTSSFKDTFALDIKYSVLFVFAAAAVITSIQNFQNTLAIYPVTIMASPT